MNRQRSGRLGVGVVGAGRVGPVLAAALAGAGHAVVGVSALSERSRDRADAMLPGVPILDVPEVVRRSELVLLTVPDAELPGLVEGLAATGVWQPGQIVAHTSAKYGTAVLAPAAAAGVIPLALHPAMVFTGTSVDLSALTTAWFGVTAAAPVQPIGQALVVEMGAEPVLIAEADRATYAEAIETVSAFSRSIVEQSVSLLRGIGVESPGFFLSALARSSLDHALAHAQPDSIDLGSLPEPDPHL